MAKTGTTSDGGVRKRWLNLRRTGRIITAIITVLLVVRLILPWVVRNRANHRLSQMGEHRGHVDEVALSLWKGAYHP